jgi:hypothetical protein
MIYKITKYTSRETDQAITCFHTYLGVVAGLNPTKPKTWDHDDRQGTPTSPTHSWTEFCPHGRDEIWKLLVSGYVQSDYLNHTQVGSKLGTGGEMEGNQVGGSDARVGSPRFNSRRGCWDELPAQ